MTKYIATFFSHFGATRYNKELQKYNINCKLMPVPRSVSSSCGTCVSYEAEKMFPEDIIPDYVEKIFEISNSEKYILKYEIKD